MKKSISFSIFIAFTSNMFAQSTIQWQKNFGGSLGENAKSIQQTNDGGYIVVGRTYSNDGDVIGNHGELDLWVLKLGPTGTIQWQKSLGGSGRDEAASVRQTNDGGYIIAGSTDSEDGDIILNHGSTDFWVVKLNGIGSIQWQKTFGGTVSEGANSIQQTTDGGYIVAGSTRSNDGDVTSNYGQVDFWVLKLTDFGTIQWQETFGGSEVENAHCIQETMDGGFIIAGYTSSNDGEVSGHHGASDFWVIKLNSFGKLLWQKTLGGSFYENGRSIQQTNDGGYIVLGTTSSYDGDVTGCHGESDFWLVKLSGFGDVQWQKALGGSKNDIPYVVNLTTDGGFVLAGYTSSNDGHIIENHGDRDVWVLKLSESGDIEWQRTYGGTLAETAFSISQTSDGGLIIAGESKSNDGDLSENNGNNDFWIVKLSPTSSGTHIPMAHDRALEIVPNPASTTVSLRILSEEPAFNVIVFDLMGSKISRQTVGNSGSIDVSTLKNGLYLLMATTASGKVFSNKFMKCEN